MALCSKSGILSAKAKRTKEEREKQEKILSNYRHRAAWRKGEKVFPITKVNLFYLFSFHALLLIGDSCSSCWVASPGLLPTYLHTIPTYTITHI
ncbi:uncharacterized protein BP01DRAFT_3833 [Aspergillus saccharolyticus JOP 1030-1]|uniref:Uncharacterized protein n=1 Tax=Aspergillus saccharolyticus JOP 1030-1 TaxID=1450539 RepID=A0A318ZSU8_9EURO|nr:hypothetical protein BP01DRAFT_3833 [Aspergillus saccharolyticus JOP 1030-1]PYH49714.1 hypothetical protein BP01DRAFT_3833 [Aspergillus saccharolyticus JOP 1030-1]